MTISKCCGSGGSSAPSQDRFAPKYVVGNALAGDTAAAYATGGFTYIEDPGDGTGIEAALALAVTDPGDISVRPGVYDFATGAAVMPLSIPAGTRVVGSGSGSCELRSRTAGDQGIFLIEGANVGIEHIAFTVQSGGEVIYLGSRAVIANMEPGTGYVHQCTFALTLAGTSVLSTCILDAGPGAFSVRLCSATGPSVGGTDSSLWTSFVATAKTGPGRTTFAENSCDGFDVPLLCDDTGGTDNVLVQDLTATGFARYAVLQLGSGFLGISDSDFFTENTAAGGVLFGAGSITTSSIYAGSYLVETRIQSAEIAQDEAAVMIQSGVGGGYVRVQHNLIRWPRLGAAVVAGNASGGSCAYNLIQGNQIFNTNNDPTAVGVEIVNNGCISNIVSTNVIVATTAVVNGSTTTQILGNTP